MKFNFFNKIKLIYNKNIIQSSKYNFSIEIFTYLLLIIIFLLSHSGFFFEIPLPEFRPDWSGYFKIMRDILNGEAPNISIRPVGYILFVIPVFGVFQTYTAVVVVQSLIMLAASLFLVRGFFRVSSILGVLSGFAMFIVLGRGITLLINLRVLTDTIYSSTIIFICAFILYYFITRRTLYIILLSLAVGYLVLTKPAGHWAVVTLVLFTLAVFFREKSAKLAFIAILPAAMIGSTLVLYNGFFYNIWAVNAYGGANIAGATWFYWEKSDNYSNTLNFTIEKIDKNKWNCERWPSRCISQADLNTIETSWNPRKLSNAYQNLFGFWKRSWKFGLKQYLNEKYDGKRHLIAGEANSELLHISLNAISEHPGIYARTVAATLYRQWVYFFSDGFYYKPEIYKEINSKLSVFKKRKWVRDDPYLALGQGYQRFPTENMANYISRTGGTIRDDPPFIRAYRSYFEGFHRSLSERSILGVFFIPVMIVSGLLALGTRFRHDGALIAFLITSGCFGAGLLVAMVELGTVKYAMPTAFMQYLALPLLVMCLPRFRDIHRARMHN